MSDPAAPSELATQLLHGEIDRRGFIRRAATLGLSASAIGAILAACGGAESPTAPATATTGGPASGRTPAAPSPGATMTMPAASAASTPLPGGGAGGAAPGGRLGAPSTKPLGRGGGIGPGPAKRGGGGQLKLLWWQAPTILNPHLVSGTKDVDACRLVYEPLASFDADDTLVPFLAAEIPTRENGGLSSDGKVVTWTLKPGVKWSDGTPSTARDVAFTWRYVTDEQTASGGVADFQGVTKVEAVGDTTCRITFADPSPGWYVPFTGDSSGSIIPEHSFRDGIGPNAKNFPANLQPIGTGPYRVTTFKPGDQIEYELNPNWRDPNGPSFDAILLKGGGDAASAARAVFQTGDFHVAWNLQVEPQVLSQLRQGNKAKEVLQPAFGVERLLVNLADPNEEVNGQRSEKNTPHPFQADKRVREAYAFLCDRKTIAETLYAGGVPTANLSNDPKTYASPNTAWEFNLQRANALLDAAGWARGGQYRARGGVPMKILYQTSTNSVRQKAQQIIKDALEKAGIQVELRSIDANVLFDSDPGDPDTAAHFYADLQMYSTLNGSPDPWTCWDGWTTAQNAQQENSWDFNHHMRWSIKEFDEPVAAARLELDEAKRAALFIKANDIQVNDFAQIALVDRKGYNALANGFAGAELAGWDSVLWNVANWTKG